MQLIGSLLRQSELIPLFLSIAIGYLIGKLRIGRFQLGGMAGTLICAVVIGQFGVPVNSGVKTIMFALFIYATGYVSGPQFFGCLNRRAIRYVQLSLVSAVIAFAMIFGVSKAMKFDKGTAAGLLAGATTESASLGTAGEALQRLGLGKEKVKEMEANMGLTYAITYLFGMMTVMIFTGQFAPRLLGINLKEEAEKLEREMGSSGVKLEPGQYSAFGVLDARVFRVSGKECIGKSVRDIEERFSVKVEQAAYQGKRVEVSPDLVLQEGSRVAIQGELEHVISAGAFIGEETPDTSGIEFINEELDVAVTRRELDGKTIAEAKDMLNLRDRYGVHATRLSRLDREIELYPHTELHVGDVVRFVGSAEAVAKASREVGYPLKRTQVVDYVYFALGMLAGVLLGLPHVSVGGVPISLGTGGGCLISGLIFGWLRAKYQTFGNLPASTAQYLRDFGLAVFIASVGLAAGPQALTQIKQHGLVLPLLGIIVALVPLLLGTLYGRYRLKTNPVVLCGALTGNLTCTPALNDLVELADSNTPVLGYTVTYTISNVLLTFRGPIIVFVT